MEIDINKLSEDLISIIKKNLQEHFENKPLTVQCICGKDLKIISNKVDDLFKIYSLKVEQHKCLDNRKFALYCRECNRSLEYSTLIYVGNSMVLKMSSCDCQMR